MVLKLETPAFQDGARIPVNFTCEGRDLSPALVWSGVPGGARSLVLICDDPDAPAGTWVHWVLYGMAPSRTSLPEGLPADPQIQGVGVQGKNDFKKLGYGGPCPPRGKAHRYMFKLYALDSTLALKPGAKKAEVERAMKGHVVAEARVSGTYQR